LLIKEVQNFVKEVSQAARNEDADRLGIPQQTNNPRWTLNEQSQATFLKRAREIQEAEFEEPMKPFEARIPNASDYLQRTHFPN